MTDPITDPITAGSSGCDKCAERENVVVGEPQRRRLREVCLSCGMPVLINDRYTIARKLSGNRHTNADVFVVFDRQDIHVQKILKVLTNQEPHVLKMFKIEQIILTELDHPGIPKSRDAFEILGPNALAPNVSASDHQFVPCIVMEKIQGETLQDYINHHGCIDETLAIDWMNQLTKILGYVHSQKLFHRDIKPTNIMLRDDGSLALIDFGTSRHITQTIVNGGTNTVIFSYGYTAPEQLIGKAEIRSDFYALGRTFLHLLMGELPSEWKTFSPKVVMSNPFLKLLKELSEDEAKHRPRNAQAILKRLRSIQNAPRNQRLKTLGSTFVGGMVCGSIIMTPLLKKVDWEQLSQDLFPAPTCDNVMNDHISCGEEMLITSMKEGRSVPDKKEEGIRLMREGKYLEAREAFKEAFLQERDPETLIYLNNAKINADATLRKDKVTIAAVVPIGRAEAKSRAMAILRGIAQAQNDAVNKLKRGIEVVIVDDYNRPDRSAAVAKVFTKRRGILAGVGHSSSDALISALPIYKTEKMVFVAPASTSEEFSGAALEANHVFFRSLASNRISAMYINQLLVATLKQKKVAIYYNPDSPYSRSLASAFREVSESSEIKIIDDPMGKFLISNGTFNAKEALAYAHAQGVTAHILIPDAGTSQNGVRNALQFVKENQSKDWIIAGDSLAGMPDYLSNENGPFASKMIFAAAWDVSDDRNSPLIKFWSDSLMNQDNPVDWRTLTSYNATWILATALNDSAVRSRVRLQEKLSEPTFKADSLGVELRFRERSGEVANPNITLTTIAKCGDRYITVNFRKPVCPNSTPNPNLNPP